MLMFNVEREKGANGLEEKKRTKQVANTNSI